MTRVRLKCPCCSKTNYIEITDDLLKNVSRGLIAVNINPGIICLHSFITYIDLNFSVRDYFIPDFQLEISEESSIVPSNTITSSEIEIVNLDLLKLNFSPIMAVYILKSIFSKKKVLIILEQLSLYRHILNFFKYLTSGTFGYTISIINEAEYSSNKQKYLDYIVLKSNKIINDPQSILMTNTIKIQKQFINAYYAESDLESNFINLKNEIQKSYQMSKAIVEFLNNKKIDKNNQQIIEKHLQDKFKINISQEYLNFLLDIVQNYFGFAYVYNF